MDSSLYPQRPAEKVACGPGHTAIITAAGELWTWGDNKGGACGHKLDRPFVPRPRRVSCLHRAPRNIALRKPTRQSSVYNKRYSYLANDGDLTGDREDNCTHTHHDHNAWWEVDLGKVSAIDEVRVTSRRNLHLKDHEPRDKYSRRLFPFWILLSLTPLPGGFGSLERSQQLAVRMKRFDSAAELTTWMPPAGTLARYVRYVALGEWKCDYVVRGAVGMVSSR